MDWGTLLAAVVGAAVTFVFAQIQRAKDQKFATRSTHLVEAIREICTVEAMVSTGKAIPDLAQRLASIRTRLGIFGNKRERELERELAETLQRINELRGRIYDYLKEYNDQVAAETISIEEVVKEGETQHFPERLTKLSQTTKVIKTALESRLTNLDDLAALAPTDEFKNIVNELRTKEETSLQLMTSLTFEVRKSFQ